VFVAGEVDMVSGVGYNPAKRGPGGNYSAVSLRSIVTNLCVMDFGGKDNAIRVISLHPGVTFDEVQSATGFALEQGELAETALPTAEQLAVIASLDPHNIRATAIKDNPPARRQT
jgi:glutaconate CoA-transferase subunit B